MMVMWERSQWLGKNIVGECWLKELQESMDTYTGHHNIPEIIVENSVKHHTINLINLQ